MSRGFTLVELLIAIGILAFLSTFTAQSIRSALSNRRKISRDIEHHAIVRDTLRIMEKDINQAFHFQHHNEQLFNLALLEKEKRAKTSSSQQSTEKDPTKSNGEGEAPIDEAEQRQQELDALLAEAEKQDSPSEPIFKPRKVEKLTHFQGDNDKLHFTALTPAFMVTEQQLSQQKEVGYYTKNCRSRTDLDKSSLCLYRRVSNEIDDDVTEGGGSTILLENVKSFELKYLGPGKDDWVQTWHSGVGSDDTTKDHFPYAVEVTLKIEIPVGKKKKEFTSSMVAAIRFPNNESFAEVKTEDKSKATDDKEKN